MTHEEKQRLITAAHLLVQGATQKLRRAVKGGDANCIIAIQQSEALEGLISAILKARKEAVK